MRGFAPLGRLMILAMVAAGLGTVTLATAETAQAASSNAPTAIGVSGNGTSYVGFSSGGKLVRLNAKGKKLKPLSIDQDSPVEGIVVTGDNKVIVGFGPGLTVLNAKGKVQAEFDYGLSPDCSGSYPATRYGGVAFGGGRIWVAHRCASAMSVLNRSGNVVARVSLPGRPGGVTFGNAQSGKPATVWVSLPDSSRVVGFKAGGIKSSSSPAHSTKIKRPYRGKAPRPSGIAVDRFGQLTVADTANHAVYLLDTNHNFSLYRTLGHPPRASRAAGRLNSPGAIAQHDQDGGSLSGNLFIADTNNSRIQRWDTGGYTHWAKKVNAGSKGGGGGGSCSADDWDCGGGGGGGGNDNDDDGWGNDNGGDDDGWGDDDGGDNGGNDDGWGDDGGDNGWGNDDGGDDGGGGSSTGPDYLTAPAITGAPEAGSTLTCTQGTWASTTTGAGRIDYARQWLREGTPIAAATAATYTITTADLGKRLSCRVTATDGGGSTSYTTPAVTVAAGGGPTNTVPPRINGTASVGGTLTCVEGAWSGTGIDYAYQWRRDGSAIPGATARTYTVVAADRSAALTCTVTASDATGSTSRTSDPVAVAAAPVITGSAAPGEVISCAPADAVPAGATVTYQWRRGDVVIPLATWPTYTVLNADLAAGVLTCTVTVTSGGSTTAATSAGKTVGGWSGHAPSNAASAPTISGQATVGATITCAPGTWAGTPPVEVAVKWQRNGADVAGATSTAYSIPAGDLGASLACVVIASNGYGKAAAATAPVTVTPAPPTNTVAPSITGAARIGSAVTCERGTWTGTGLTYRYSWSRDGVAIPDTDAPTYVVLSADAAADLTCTVTATNSVASASSTSAVAKAETFVGTAPTPPTGGPVITGTPATGQVLTCDRGTWTGTAPITYVTLWQRDGATVANGATYTLTAADAAASIRCVVVGTGVGKGAARSAAVGGNSCGGAVGVTIADGAETVTTAQVRLSIRPPAGATEVWISGTGDFSGVAPVPLSASCTYDWTLPSVPGIPLDARVWVRFGPSATDPVYSDTIRVAVPNTLLSLGW